MNEILDHQEPEIKKKISRQVLPRAIVYVLIMVAGGGCFFYFAPGPFDRPFQDFSRALSAGKYFIFQAFGFMLIVEMVKLIYRRLRKIERHLEHPLWFELVENTFLWWILYIVLILISMFFG